MQTDNDKKLEATDKVYRFNDTVKLKVAYPKDYPAAKRHLKDGEIIEVHTIQADTYIKKGIAKEIK